VSDDSHEPGAYWGRGGGAAGATAVPQLQYEGSDAAASRQSTELDVSSSISEGLTKDVVITRSIQLKEAQVSDCGESKRDHHMSPSTPFSLKTPHTCPAALNHNRAVGPHLQPLSSQSWLPVLHGPIFSEHTPSPVGKFAAFFHTRNLPNSSPTNKWRKAAQITSKVCFLHNFRVVPVVG
jgi:hypothetical protein